MICIKCVQFKYFPLLIHSKIKLTIVLFIKILSSFNLQSPVGCSVYNTFLQSQLYRKHNLLFCISHIVFIYCKRRKIIVRYGIIRMLMLTASFITYPESNKMQAFIVIFSHHNTVLLQQVLIVM